MIMPTQWPTVRLVVTVPEKLPTGGWRWVDHPDGGEVGREYVYSCRELHMTFRSWGPAVARVLIGPRWDMFNITAYGAYSGNVLGRDAWRRSEETGRLRAQGDPLCCWENARFPPDMAIVRPIELSHCAGLGHANLGKAA